MNPFISLITAYLRTSIATDWATRIYRANNINVVDDAYAETIQCGGR